MSPEDMAILKELPFESTTAGTSGISFRIGRGTINVYGDWPAPDGERYWLYIRVPPIPETQPKRIKLDDLIQVVCILHHYNTLEVTNEPAD
jgi:hypothetical protein